MVHKPVSQLVVLAHPDPGSFCAEAARHWQSRALSHGQQCEILDLYANGFDPVLRANEQGGKPGFAVSEDVAVELKRLDGVDVLVFIYPLWFGTPPAILKGYIERVLGSSTSFGTAGKVGSPLAGKAFVQLTTSAYSRAFLAERGVEAAFRTLYDRYIAHMLGAEHTRHLHLDSIVVGMSAGEAVAQLACVCDLAENVCAEANVARWDRERTGSGCSEPAG